MTEPSHRSLLSGFVKPFLSSRLSVILVITALCLGAASIYLTPKEEEPQIVVPMADIYVNAPGANPKEIETLVATPLEQLLWEIDGVEYVYSVSSSESAIVTVRFRVGEEREASLIKLHNKIQMNLDRVPSIVSDWLIKPMEIDDVPVLTLALYSDQYHDHELERVGREMIARLSRLENISRSEIYGGRKREIRVEIDPLRMKGFKVSIQDIESALKGADVSIRAGNINQYSGRVTISSSSFLTSVEQLKSLVVANEDSKPVFLEDVATIIDGPAEASSYSRIQFSNRFLNAHPQLKKQSFPCVTLAFSKKKGTNAVTLTRQLLKEVKELKRTMLPSGIYLRETRNYGRTAQEKVNELLASLGFAISCVIVLIAISLGWREALVVALAVPISFSLALFVNYLFGYSINRVTLFALILSLGLVVDDPITNVDNIQRHIKTLVTDPLAATLNAVQEVLPPVIMSTIAIIICFLPLSFITGMMGPYMSPMAVNVPLTVIFSTLCALTIVPWASFHLLKNQKTPSSEKTNKPSLLGRVYPAVLNPFLNHRAMRYGLLAAIILLLIGSCSLGLLRWVPLKLLPFDNKNEFQLVIDLPEGSTLEQTDRVVRNFEDYLRTVNEVEHTISFTGMASPMDFNGMVRHYFIRKDDHLAEIRVNLAHKSIRKQQSHAILLRIRTALEAIAQENHAQMQLVEVPPGPPVLSTLVAEIYGAPDSRDKDLLDGAGHVKTVMEEEPFVTDVKIMTEKESRRINYVVDREKAALHGIDTKTILDALKNGIKGIQAASLHIEHERDPLWINTILPLSLRSDMVSVLEIPVRSETNALIPLAELIHPVETRNAQPIYHKNLEPVVYVIGEMAGQAPGEAVLDMMSTLKKDPVPQNIKVVWSGEGEWKITLRVFRDMGLSFAAALIGIYLLLVINTGSYFLPVLIMMAIPLTLLGIMPGFFILNLFSADVGGFQNPVFFTATSMIGMIALGGIVIRNSLVLIEFIQEAVKKGQPLKEAIIQSGIVRMRPILLTALTTAFGASPIVFDPVFSGLAWALIFGLFASTLFTLLVVPVTYYAVYKNKDF